MRDTDPLYVPEDPQPKGSPTNPYITGRQAAVLAAGVAGAVLVLVWVVSRG